MNINSPRLPSYRLHKPSGLAVVTVHGKDQYLGQHGSPESHAEYDRIISEWLARGRNRPKKGATNASSVTVNEAILAVWKQAELHYRHPDGTPTGELDNLRDALRPLRRLYGHTPANKFGPLCLRAVREDMIKADLCRRTINARINRIRRVFRWAASIEVIPVEIPQALATVAGLQRGRSAARESEGVKPVNWDHVEATLPFLPRPVAAMVQVMRYSNCRAEDVVIMRGKDITRVENDEVWTYRPTNHKNAWRGHDRIIYLGKNAQEALQPFLSDDPTLFLFSPKESLREHHALRGQRRQSKRTPSELRKHRQVTPKWTPREHYDVNSFQQAVRRACGRAGVPRWSILQLRHARATEVRERYGVEGAAASLGHRRVETSQIYAEKNERLSKDIARNIG